MAVESSLENLNEFVERKESKPTAHRDGSARCSRHRCGLSRPDLLIGRCPRQNNSSIRRLFGD